MRVLISTLVMGITALLLAVPATAAPFTQCPMNSIGAGGPDNNGAHPSCEYLLTINPNGSVTVSADTALLTNISNDQPDVEDTLIGVQNNSGRTISALRVSSGAESEFFDFGDADFAYTGTGNVFFTDLAPLVGDIQPSGTVNFAGGLAAGGHTWFGLEGASQVDGDPVTLSASVVSASVVPEPGSLLLISTGLLGLFGLGRARRRRTL